MKYLIVVFVFFLFNSCFPCLDIEKTHVANEEGDVVYNVSPNLIKEYAKINYSKIFTIENHTGKTYIKNALYLIQPGKKNGIWRLENLSKNIGWQNEKIFIHHKINTINPKEKKINKNEKGDILKLAGAWYGGCRIGSEYNSEEKLFLLSLDGGKRKIFFGAYGGAYGEHVKKYWGEVTSDCKQYVIKYDVHPFWQKKDLTIHIYDNKITFSDPKIKEVKKLKLSIYGSTKTEEVDPYALELVDCSKE